MATMAFIGTGAAPALAGEYNGYNDKDNGNVNFEVDRSNNLEQEQEACTNEVEVEAGGDAIQLVDAEQTNDCEVDQEQNAAIIDFSTFEAELESVFAEFD